MTTFTQIYTGDHNFLEGMIEITNTAGDLTKAYVEVLVSGVPDNKAYPMHLGFLYQVDADLKRSRPYPIVSQRQTILLDMSDCYEFLFIPVSRLIDDYTLSLSVSSESVNGSVDLSNYALTSQLPNLSNYVSESGLATVLSGYALTSQLPNLSNYALTSQLPNLSDYITSNDLSTAIAAIPAPMTVHKNQATLSQNTSASIPSVNSILGVYERVASSGSVVSPQNMTGYNTPSPFVIAANTDSNGDYPAWKAFDGINSDNSSTNFWLSTSLPAILGVDLASSTPVSSYSICMGTPLINSGHRPKTWTFEGSNNGSDWTVLDARDNPTNGNWNGGQLYNYQLADTVNYRYYRINITNSDSTQRAGLSELILFGASNISWVLQPSSNYQASIADGTEIATIKKLSAGTNVSIEIHYL